MKEIIKNIKAQIKSCKKYKQDLDEASWGYETGVLLTANEAQKIVDKLNEEKKRKKKTCLP
jgi:F0F1-type ATP synthase membrane subunit b/b'